MTRNLQPLYTRPFDMESAKAGAPYALACGWPVEIFKWDAKSAGGPILGIFGTDDRISTWRANGEFSIQDNPRLNLVMVPLGYLDGKPVFVGDKLEQRVRDGWVGHDAQADWNGPAIDWEYDMRWPAPPKVYPVTGMSIDETKRFIDLRSHEETSYAEDLQILANFVLHHYIDNLTVLPDDCALRAKLVEMGWTAPKGDA